MHASRAVLLTSSATHIPPREVGRNTAPTGASRARLPHTVSSRTDSAPGERRDRRAGLLAFALGTLAILTGAGYLGSLTWALELASHFRLQYAIVAALLIPVAAWWKGRWWALAALGIAAVDAGAVVPLYISSGHRPAGPPLSVLAFNVSSSNLDTEEIVAFVVETDADVTVLMEVSEVLHDRLTKLEGPQELVLSEPRVDNFGIALVARVPVEAEIVSSQGLPFVEVRLVHGGKRWSILGAHPVPPVGPLLAAQRNASFDDIAAWARRQEGPHAVVGDLNCTPFSPRFWMLLDASGLQSTQPGYGYQATWPQNEPLLWLAQIPVDHALVGGGAFATQRRLGPSLGSDHRGLIVDLAVE